MCKTDFTSYKRSNKYNIWITQGITADNRKFCVTKQHPFTKKQQQKNNQQQQKNLPLQQFIFSNAPHWGKSILFHRKLINLEVILSIEGGSSDGLIPVWSSKFINHASRGFTSFPGGQNVTSHFPEFWVGKSDFSLHAPLCLLFT